MNFNSSAKFWCYRFKSHFALNADPFYLVSKEVVTLMGTFNRSNREAMYIQEEKNDFFKKAV